MLLFAAGCGKDAITLNSFREIDLGVQADLSAVWFGDSLNGLVCGGTAWESGILLSTDDGGATWQTDTLLNRKLEQVTGDPSGQSYACGQDQLLIRPAGERHWQVLRTDYQWLRDAHFPSNNYGAVVSGEGFHSGLLRVFGPDAFWKQDTLHEVTGELDAVWYVDSTVLVAGGAGWLIRSTDAGQSWERLRHSGDVFTSIHFPDAKTGYCCGSSGALLKSTDGGATWSTIRKGGASGSRNKGFRALWFSNAETGWLVGDGGIFWHTDDGGDSWQRVDGAPQDADFTDVFTLGNRGWATAKDGRFFEFGF